MNKIDLIDRDSGLEYNTETVELFCNAVLRHLEIDGWELSLMICDDEFIAELNSKYRQKEGPTDILTFCNADTEPGWALNNDETAFYAGDMVISSEMLKRNSEYFKVDVEEELKRLIIHGILHLNGMEHRTNNADEEMLVLQERILKDFGDFKF